MIQKKFILIGNMNGYVIKNSDGQYFSGFNTTSDKLIKARIYSAITYAQKSAKDLNANTSRTPNIKHDFKVIKIKIEELE